MHFLTWRPRVQKRRTSHGGRRPKAAAVGTANDYQQRASLRLRAVELARRRDLRSSRDAHL